ncbi:MAG TPA: glucose/sorbosone family PQQ-dependent dehydrogenase [Vicinamibacterales bacterium]|nr:glucose/sorbosone family PQQ-dependent dehydrogenase [Vicinamibacterales bacterium]
MRTVVAAVMCGLIVFVSVIAQHGPETVVRGTKQFRQTEVVTGLAGPWEVTWGPDNMLWVTEREGKRITRVNPATGERKVAITIDEVSAPGGQDGLLGMALDLGINVVYAGYTYVDKSLRPIQTRAATSPYRFLYTKVVRLTYDRATETLRNPVTLIAGLPAGNDHNAGRLKIGPDRKLYYSIGDHGNDQLGNYCVPIAAQRLPTAAELQAKNYASYVGKVLRLNPDGSIPTDNPQIAGVRSHVFSYGHRNPQGIDFGPDGTLYEAEHGPKTDDELNIIKAGANYGWPHVAGLKDNKAYEYARWAESTTPCEQLTFSDLAIPPSVPKEPESAFTRPFTEPIATMFTVPSTYNFSDPVCKGIDYICWPTIGISSIEYYGAPGKVGIPGWDKVLFVPTLKRGSLYVVALSPDGQSVRGHFSRYFQSDNRYRDTAVSPDGRTIYIATDPSGLAEATAGGTTRSMTNKGSILAFTYVGEGTGAPIEPQRTTTTEAPSAPATPAVAGAAPQYTAAQAAAGRTAFNADCAVCHGNTLTNGTMAPPLAGESFHAAWTGRSVRALFDAAKMMPPANPGSLPDETYRNILAYILQVNGYAAGETPFATGDGATLK